jgi:hypothetical protein
MTPDVMVALCSAFAALVGLLVERHRLDVRERLARLEARCDALERGG